MRSFRDAPVIVIGELNVDILATGLTRTPMLGTEVLAGDVALRLGSASAIFACGMAKLGHPVTFIGQVGNDDFGEFCLSELRAAGIGLKNVSRSSGLRTGVTLALSTTSDRALVTYPGAIASFGYAQLRVSALEGHRHLHMTSYFLQTALRPAFAKLFRQARALGLTTSFDPNSDPSQKWTQGINRVLRHTDILFLNKLEALQFTRLRNVRSALKKLGQLVPCAVVKLGRNGSMAIRNGQIVRMRAFPVDSVDTTGAGDSFAAGFMSTYLRNGPLDDCLLSGNACGALSTLKAGGTAGQPTRAALKTFLNKHQR